MTAGSGRFSRIHADLPCQRCGGSGIEPLRGSSDPVDLAPMERLLQRLDQMAARRAEVESVVSGRWDRPSAD